MLLAPIPWAQRVWALPFLTVPAPSERCHQERGKRHKQLTDRARQMIFQVRQRLPERVLVVVADGSYAALELLAACQGVPNPVAVGHALAPGCGLVRPGVRAPSRATGSAAQEGRAAADPGAAAQRPDHRLAARQRALVWRNDANGAAGIGNGGLAAQRLAAGERPLGAHH